MKFKKILSVLFPVLLIIFTAGTVVLLIHSSGTGSETKPSWTDDIYSLDDNQEIKINQKLINLNSEVMDIRKSISETADELDLQWESGTLQNGEELPSEQNQFRTSNPIAIKDYKSIRVSAGEDFLTGVSFYASPSAEDTDFITSYELNKGEYLIKNVFPENCYIRFVAGRSDDEYITGEELSENIKVTGIKELKDITAAGTASIEKQTVFSILSNRDYVEDKIVYPSNRLMSYYTKFDYPVVVSFQSDDYYFKCSNWEKQGSTFSKTYDSAWMESYRQEIPANTYFTVCFCRKDDVSISREEVCDTFSVDRFTEGDEPSDYTYEFFIRSYTGEKIDLHDHYLIESYLWLGDMTVDGTNNVMQAFSIHNGVLFQALGDEYLRLFDYSNGSIISTMDFSEFGHVNSMCFSDEFYSPEDEFPLLYVTSDSSESSVSVVRVTRTEATRIREYNFTNEEVGYYANHALDSANNILYMIGYSEKNFQTDADGNHMIITAWNIKDGKRELISTTTHPFIYVIQDRVFRDGKIVLLSSYNNRNSTIYFYDVASNSISSVLDDLDFNLKVYELEGVDFVKEDNEDVLIISANEFYYVKLKFPK